MTLRMALFFNYKGGIRERGSGMVVRAIMIYSLYDHDFSFLLLMRSNKILFLNQKSYFECRNIGRSLAWLFFNPNLFNILPFILCGGPNWSGYEYLLSPRMGVPSPSPKCTRIWCLTPESIRISTRLAS